MVTNSTSLSSSSTFLVLGESTGLSLPTLLATSAVSKNNLFPGDTPGVREKNLPLLGPGEVIGRFRGESLGMELGGSGESGEK